MNDKKCAKCGKSSLVVRFYTDKERFCVLCCREKAKIASRVKYAKRKQALAIGVEFLPFTPRACSREGCSRDGILLQAHDFCINRAQPDGRDVVCRNCKNAMSRKWVEKNYDSFRASIDRSKLRHAAPVIQAKVEKALTIETAEERAAKVATRKAKKKAYNDQWKAKNRERHLLRTREWKQRVGYKSHLGIKQEQKQVFSLEERKAKIEQQFEAAIRDGRAVRITLPLPPRRLCSNKPGLTAGARMLRAVETKAYRARAKKEADRLAPSREEAFMWPKCSAKLIFWFERKGRRDIRNFEAGMKAAYDGLVDAGLIIDDNSDVLTHEETVFEIDPVAPRVEIIITNKEAAA